MTDDRIDELRQRLRALGYLDAGVDRFVLAPARGSRGPLALAIRASMRVGLLGGVLLGPAAAVGLGARLPGLVSGVRDAAVLAAYFAVLSFLAATVLSFAISIIATTIVNAADREFGRMARRMSAAAGAVIAAGCMAYLTLWWGNANAGFGWSAPVWTSLALVVAAAISLLLGHAVRLTTLAALAARRGAADLPPVPARSWRVIVGGGAFAFVGAAALLVLTAAAESPAGDDHPALAVRSPGLSVRVIAIDGFDPAIAETASSPAAARCALRSCIRLDPQDTSDPARAWTTIATGEPPDVHGVRGIETRRVAGVQGSVAAGGGTLARALGAATDAVRLTRPSIASRDERRSKTLWEVAEDAGLRTAVVNWWATWPAPPGPGIVVTDRAVLRLEHGGPLDAEISPASLYPVLQQAWSGIRARARDAAAKAFDDAPDAATASILRRSAELDVTILGMADAIPGPKRDLDVLYLPGLDIAQHALLASPEASGQAPSAVAARVDALRRYYGFLAHALEPIATPTGNHVVMTITQPGRVQTPVAGLFGVQYADRAIEVTGTARGQVLDVAPTVLYALGLPLSRELAGRELKALLTPDIIRVNGDRSVTTYGRPFARPPARASQPLDQEMIDRLRSLGYVK